MTDLGDQSGRDETGSAEAAMRDALLALLDFDVAAPTSSPSTGRRSR